MEDTDLLFYVEELERQHNQKKPRLNEDICLGLVLKFTKKNILNSVQSTLTILCENENEHLIHFQLPNREDHLNIERLGDIFYFQNLAPNNIFNEKSKYELINAEDTYVGPRKHEILSLKSLRAACILKDPSFDRECSTGRFVAQKYPRDDNKVELASLSCKLNSFVDLKPVLVTYARKNGNRLNCVVSDGYTSGISCICWSENIALKEGRAYELANVRVQWKNKVRDVKMIHVVSFLFLERLKST